MNDRAVSSDVVAYLGRPTAVTWWDRFCEGAGAPWLGLQFLNRRKALWRYAFLPLLANLFITALVLASLVFAAAWFVTAAHPWFQSHLAAWPRGAAIAAEAAFAVVLLIFCLGASLFLWMLLTGVLCGHFYGILARHVEMELGASAEELRSLSLHFQTVDTVIDLATLTAIHTTFLCVGLVPLAGAPVAAVGNFSLSWFILGADYLDFPLALRGMRRRERRRFCREHLPHTLGLGAVVFVMEFIPILGAVFLTTATVGGVLLHRRLISNAMHPRHNDAPSKLLDVSDDNADANVASGSKSHQGE